MAANKTIKFGPVYIAGTAGNLFNVAVTSMTGPVGITLGQPYAILRHIRIVNRTTSAATFSLFIGATGGSAAGTEFMGGTLSVPANSYVDWYGMVRLESTDFLSGIAGTASALVIEGEGEVGLS
jgi:hypothetical protein